MPVAAKDFNFLSEGARRQRDLAQKVLQQAKDIDELLKKIDDPAIKDQLSAKRDNLLSVARELASIATSTSSSSVDLLNKLPS